MKSSLYSGVFTNVEIAENAGSAPFLGQKSKAVADRLSGISVFDFFPVKIQLSSASLGYSKNILDYLGTSRTRKSCKSDDLSAAKSKADIVYVIVL